MAKGQQRGNREARKPKQQKPTAEADNPTGSQIKLAVNGNRTRQKPKVRA